MTVGNQAVKAASPLRKRLRIYTATKNGSIAQFEKSPQPLAHDPVGDAPSA